MFTASRLYNDHAGTSPATIASGRWPGRSGRLHRVGDMTFRYGGEEFAAILPRTDGPGASGALNGVLETVRELSIPHPGSRSGRGVVTLSVGCSTATLGRDASPADLIHRADRALYEAKALGRDRTRRLGGHRGRLRLTTDRGQGPGDPAGDGRGRRPGVGPGVIRSFASRISRKHPTGWDAGCTTPGWCSRTEDREEDCMRVRRAFARAGILAAALAVVPGVGPVHARGDGRLRGRGSPG